MNEPRRLREECESPLERALLEAGASYRSSDGTRERTLAALGLAGSAALSAAAIGTATSTLSKVSWAKALTVVSAVSAVTAVPVGYYAWQRSEQQAAVAQVALSAPKAPVTGTQRAVRHAEPALPSTHLMVEPVAPAPLVNTPSARAPKATASSADLTAELAAIEKARSALSAGDASGALSQLDAYSRTYPRGRLALEAEVLRIDALARSGQRDAAKKRAEQFVRRHPNSVLNARVRGYLGE
ncbi:MAG TPA: outer membrane protein assembly factor BamD [Polyangiaceae bacterium]|jgi:hypothetical protein|nr:outer membrane protein assembly factor BamD [Polyangiaceae bacterium]